MHAGSSLQDSSFHPQLVMLSLSRACPALHPAPLPSLLAFISKL